MVSTFLGEVGFGTLSLGIGGLQVFCSTGMSRSY
jgi:hypothetical protein